MTMAMNGRGTVRLKRKDEPIVSLSRDASALASGGVHLWHFQYGIVVHGCVTGGRH
jgi:hypothetical protein